MKSKRVEKWNTKDFLLLIIFLIYLWLLSEILLFKVVPFEKILTTDREFVRRISLVPFDSIKLYYANGNFNIFGLLNVIGNIIIFVPLGIYMELYCKKRNTIVTIFSISIVVELVQYIFGIGIMDIDDVLLNTIGGIVGVVCYKVLKLIFRSDDKVKKVVIMLVLLGTIIFATLMLIAKSKGLRVKIL